MRVRWACMIAVAMAVAGGCDRTPQVATYPVTGTVTYQGKPVEGAAVSYVSANIDVPRPSGTTDSEGRFNLSTFFGPSKVQRGALPGEYKVVIIKETVPDQGMSEMDMTKLSGDQAREMMANQMKAQVPSQPGQDPAKPKSEIPERYGKAESTPFTQTVLSGENEPVQFELTDG